MSPTRAARKKIRSGGSANHIHHRPGTRPMNASIRRAMAKALCDKKSSSRHSFPNLKTGGTSFPLLIRLFPHGESRSVAQCPSINKGVGKALREKTSLLRFVRVESSLQKTITFQVGLIQGIGSRPSTRKVSRTGFRSTRLPSYQKSSRIIQPRQDRSGT